MNNSQKLNNIQEFKKNCKTGDILLFNHLSGGIFGVFTSLIKFFTTSKYSHCAFVLRDPVWLDPNLKGLYIWESSWEGTPDPQDGKKKLGVQITPFDVVYNHLINKDTEVYWRKLSIPPGRKLSIKKFKKIHNVVYDKPYDLHLKDWIEKIEHKDSKPQKTDRFWCSALLGYIYTELGILQSTTDWSFLAPSDFSAKYNGALTFINDYDFIEDEKKL